MGFHEDDRIRRKNAAPNTIAETYDGFKAEGLTPSDIVAKCERMLTDPNNVSIRNYILLGVMEIARRSVCEGSSD